MKTVKKESKARKMSKKAMKKTKGGLIGKVIPGVSANIVEIGYPLQSI